MNNGKSIMKNCLLTLLMLALSPLLFAYDYVPGSNPDHPIMLKGGTLYTVTDGVLANTDLIFENGRITQIGAGLTPAEGMEVIDVSGKLVYPGLIAANTSIGLNEIGAIRATRDSRETGSINPNVMTYVAYNPDSEIIPSVRANGVTTALVVPNGRLLMGQSSLMNLDGWTYEDCAEKINVGMHLSWPRARVVSAWWEERSAEEQKKQMTENRAQMTELFDQARAYYLAKKADPSIEIDTRWEAMIPLFEKEMALFVHAGDYRQIEQAIAFTETQGLKMVLVGGTDSYKLADLLKARNIPVILRAAQSSPPREDDPHDFSYSLPGMLEKVGVKFTLSRGGASGVRNLAFQAGQAIPYGLSPEMALRSLTLTPAEIFGVADDVGSLQVGKKATLIVSEGDVFDLLTHNVTMMFIGGRPVDLDNKHKELFRKYSLKKPATD